MKLATLLYPFRWVGVCAVAVSRPILTKIKSLNIASLITSGMRPPVAYAWLLLFLLLPAFVASAQPATITEWWKTWTLKNESLRAKLSFSDGGLSMSSLVNVAAQRDYLAGRSPTPLFSYTVQGVPCAASDGKWLLAGSSVSPIVLFGKTWGQRLEVTLRRTEPADFSVKEVFEIYDGGALRCFSYLKNGTDKPLTVSDSDTLCLNLPDDPHDIAYITGKWIWNVGQAGVDRQHRAIMTRYGTGDGWYILPEANWATSLSQGEYRGDHNYKFAYAYAWDKEQKVRVSTDPLAVKLTLFPHEEIEWFSADLGVFKGDLMDARAASAAHLRRRFKYIDTSFVVSYNDWYWYNSGHGRVDKAYREFVIPALQAAGLDNLLLDGEWNATNDVTAVRGNWTDMAALSQFAREHELGLGTWFCLHGSTIWGGGRDCADPATVDLKLKQVEDDLIGKYHVIWDQVDLGLCWRTDTETSYSHPGDSVYRKILGMKRFENTIADKYPGFMMQTTGEVDNVGTGPGEGICPNRGSTGLLHIPDNGTAGATDDAGDNVECAFENFGLLPLESRVSCLGDPNPMSTKMADSPMWFCQFLLSRHTMLYTQPGLWSPQIIQHMRTFNDWRKNPRIQAILSQGVLPVYNGSDWTKNQGPWCWMFTDDAKSQAIVIAINQRNLVKSSAFSAKLRWLDEKKSYLVEEITQLPDGSFNYNYRGGFSGADLKADGLPVNLDLGKEKCAMFFVQEKRGEQPQVLYADAAVTKYTSQSHGEKLTVQVEGAPNATAKVIVCNPVRNSAEIHAVTLNAYGRAAAVFSP